MKLSVTRLWAKRQRDPAECSETERSAEELERGAYMYAKMVPDELRVTLVRTVLAAEMVATRRRRRYATAVATLVALVPVAGALRVGSFTALWVIYAAAMASSVGALCVSVYAPWKQGRDLFVYGGMLGTLSPKNYQALCTDTYRTTLERLLPLPHVASTEPYATALAELDAIDALPAETLTIGPFATVAAPRIERLAPGLSGACVKLAASGTHATRSIDEVCAAVKRIYTR